MLFTGLNDYALAMGMLQGSGFIKRVGNKLHKIGEWLHHKGYLKKGLKRLVHIAPAIVRAISNKIPGVS